MSIFQFLRILWARKILIIGAAGACVIGGVIVMLVLPARWQASARVMLNTLKPDPVTGQFAAKGYVDTQAALITDYSVAGQVPVKLGWLSDPNLISSYQQSAKPGGQDFQHWATQLLTDRTKVDLQGSNILEINYTSEDPAQARTVVDALRNAYVDASLQFRRQDALNSAKWYQDQAQKIRASLETAQTTLADYERQNGVFMADNKIDVDSEQLRSLAAQVLPTITTPSNAGPSTFSAQLADIDAAIADAQEKLGPNHPQLQALRAKRKSVADLAAKQDSAQSSAMGAAAANASAMRRAVQAQQTRVIGKSDKILRVRQLQADVDLKQEQYDKMLARTADLTQEAAATDPGLTPLGPATASGKPVFPNVPLILAGSLALGLAVGICSALLAEMLARRVRSAEDLQAAIDAPVLAVIPRHRTKRQLREQRGIGARPQKRLAQA